jgi:ADP-heptose:LPS heptosyltransferase
LKRILFISATRIGDAVLSTGLLSELTRRHPDARFTIACGAAAAPLFQGHPQLERLLVLRKRPYAGHWRLLYRSTATTRWHTVVDLRRSALAWLLWTRHRRIPPKGKTNEHRLVTLARTLDFDEPPQPMVWLSGADHDRAAGLLDHDRPTLALAPTANWPAKVWPAAKFAELADRLTGDSGPLAGAQVVVTGGPGEEDQARPVLDAVPAHRRIDAVGVDLPTTAAVFARSRLFVGNDSGLMHLSGAAGAPTLGLFGPSDERLYAPQGAKCRVIRTPESFHDLVYAPGFDHRTAGSQMTNLDVGAVERAARGLLAETATGFADTQPGDVALDGGT